MATRSNSARERILNSAEALVLRKGFSSTSIDDIIAHASITKGGFFYHFDSKGGLAQALVERYLLQDDEVFGRLWAQADALSEDPLHRLLIFLNLMAEMMKNLEETHPGCLVASFTYEMHQFNENLRDLMRQGILNWRAMILERLNLIAEVYPLQIDIELGTLADMFNSTIEGGIIIARNFEDNGLLNQQILAYRTVIRSAFGAQ